MALIVLGAGATRGSEFAENNVCKPPLNDDFFTQLQRISDEKHIKVVKATIKDVISLFGKNFRVTMEEFFTQIEFYRKVLSVARERRRYTEANFNKIKDNFIAAISAVFEESITQETCEYHRKIVKSLKKDDTIISFNYDCVMDYALRDVGEDKWQAKYGYSFPLKGYQTPGIEFWNPKGVRSLATRNETIKFLKLHGSLNWQINDTKKYIRLKKHLYQNTGIPRFTIIPPEWNKEQLKQRTFTKIWKEAASRIHREKTFVLIGFSFVPTDLYAASLFQVSIKERGIKKLVIVNPDKEARRRTRTVLNRGISDETLIVQYDSVKEFSRANLDKLFSEKREIGKYVDTPLPASVTVMAPQLGTKTKPEVPDIKQVAQEEEIVKKNIEKDIEKPDRS